MMKQQDEIFIAKYVVGALWTSDIVEYADRKLCEGNYSDYYLAIIDADPKIWMDVSLLFKKSLQERKITLPSFNTSVYMLVEYHLKLIVSRAVDPIPQIRKMFGDLENFDLHKGITEYVGDNIGLETLYSWYHEDYLADKEIAKGIIVDSEKWLQTYANKH